jgi:hypothetical protein
MLRWKNDIVVSERRRQMNQISLKNPFNAFGHGFNMFSTCLQHLFAFYSRSLLIFVSASKLQQLLIGMNAQIFKNSNRIQREFSFNDAIASQNLFPASSHPRQKTNLLKLGVLSLRAADKRLGV